MGKEVEDSRMKWNVFSLETVKTALEPKFVLEKIRYRKRRKTPCFSYGDIRRSETKFLLKG